MGKNIVENARNRKNNFGKENSGSSSQNEGKKFGGGADTKSNSSREAFRKAKDQNGVPRSQQPDKTYNVQDKHTGKPLKQSDYTNSRGEKISIRKDDPYTYPDGGSQGKHYNAGKSGQKLKQHHDHD